MAKNNDIQLVKQQEARPGFFSEDKPATSTPDAKSEQANAAQEAKENQDQGLITPETPVHNVDKAVIAPGGIQGDPDPANPTLSNPSLLPHVPVYSEQTLTEVAEQNAQEQEKAPDVKLGEAVKFVNGKQMERVAFVTSVPAEGDITLHVFHTADDVDYRDNGPLGLYHGVPFSSKHKPFSWHK